MEKRYTEKEAVIISACLIGVNCKYDGNNNYNPLIIKLSEKYNLIPVCPEVIGGLFTPRTSAEIIGEKVINKDGIDVTSEFEKGANAALQICKLYNVKKAVLKTKSPSCGYEEIYDGSFSGKVIKGNGKTADLIIKNDIKIYNENEIEELIND